MLLAGNGCGPPPHAVNLPPPVEVAALGVGDVFELRIVGEDKLPSQYTVAPDGTVDIPYVPRLNVEGKEPQAVSQLIREQLIANKILRNPYVSVSIKESRSKRVEVIGEVTKSGSIPLDSGMTLLRAISISGGFNALANKSRVTITRKVKGGTVAGTVNVDDVFANRIPDPLLQSGDRIDVPQKVF